MRIDIKNLVAPLTGLFVLVLVVQMTVASLHASGAWQQRVERRGPKAEDPYAQLDGILARSLVEVPAEGVRDPFSFPTARVPVSRAPVAHRSWTPPPRPQPVLTSIIWDADPRATIRYQDQDFSVRQNSLFADFRVRSITSTQVVLEQGGEPVVLTLRSKGE